MTAKKTKDLEQPQIIDLLAELMNSGNKHFFAREQLVIYPIANQSQILYRGINDSVESKNYICAASLLRSLIESVMSLVYALTIPKDDETEFYSKFLEKGRFQRWSKGNKKWENVRDDHLITQFENATNLGVRKTYNNLCNILHFTVTHMQMMSAPVKGRPGKITVKISSEGLDVGKEPYEKIIKMSDDIMFIIKKYIAVEIHKRCKMNESVSVVASKILSPNEVKYANKQN